MIAGDATVTVYDRDGVTPRDTLDARGLSWVDELGQEGSVTLTAPWIATALATDPTLLDDATGTLSIVLQDGQPPVEIMPFIFGAGSGTLVGPDEEGDQEERFTCRGGLGILDDFIIGHDGAGAAAMRATGGTERYFGWMSKDFDDSAWTAAVAAPQTGSRIFAGYEFDVLDPAANNISILDVDEDRPAGLAFLTRKTFTLDADTTVRLYANGDDYLTLYLDGEQVFSSSEEGVELTQVKTYDTRLAAGEHVIAARIVNGNFDPVNTLAFIATLAKIDKQGNPTQIIVRTDASWLVHDDDPAQGESAARILLRLIDEAEARGMLSAGYITPTFTATTSTAPESATWSNLAGRAFRVGALVGDGFFREVRDLAFDLDMRPGFILDAYESQGTDRTATVILTDDPAAVDGPNLLEHTWQGRGVVSTRQYVLTSRGWVTVIDTASEAAGVIPRERALESGFSYTTEDGQAIAEASLGSLARLERTWVAELVAEAGITPYVDFGKGDLITAPGRTGDPTTMQVVSIGGYLPDEPGPIRWTLELVEV